jgi:NADP-dependent 3-hydroxy acid dehydrogenase YdfG
MTKNILITGASSGIGKAIGEYLTEKGHKVIGTSRRPDKYHAKFEMIALDVTDQESIKKACEQAILKLNYINHYLI